MFYRPFCAKLILTTVFNKAATSGSHESREITMSREWANKRDTFCGTRLRRKALNGERDGILFPGYQLRFFRQSLLYVRACVPDEAKT